MPKVRPAAGALATVALLLALPLGAAADARGALDATAVAVAGPSAFRAASADLRWVGEGAPLLDVTADAVHVERHGYRTERVGTLVALDTHPFRERADHADATLRLDAGDAESLVALRSPGLLHADVSDAALRPVGHASVARATPVPECTGFDPICWEVLGATETATASARVQVPGEVRLILHGPTLVVTTREGTATYASGQTHRSDGTTVVTEDAWVLVVLTGAAGSLLAEGDVALYAAAPILQTARATLDDATGRLDAGARAYVARGETMEVAGALDVAPGPVPAAPADEMARATYAAAFEVRVTGDVQAVSLRAVPLHESSPAAAAGLAALLLAVAGALAWAWPLVQFHATSALLPLYTRLKPPRLLDNQVRSAIFDIIRANPGISARGVHRLSDQSWGTVVYHLRQLEKHHLVVSRTLGRTRNYYENHGKYRGMEVQLACLRNERARVLARLVLATPGIAQEELVTRSTYPQPTTSYYVRKLKSAGLVEERRDGRYARYHPVGDVARFLELAEQEGGPAEPGAAPA